MMRTEQTEAEQAAKSADERLVQAAAYLTAQLPDVDPDDPGDVATVEDDGTRALALAQLANAEQLRALRLGLTAAIEQAARKVSR